MMRRLTKLRSIRIYCTRCRVIKRTISCWHCLNRARVLSLWFSSWRLPCAWLSNQLAKSTDPRMRMSPLFCIRSSPISTNRSLTKHLASCRRNCMSRATLASSSNSYQGPMSKCSSSHIWFVSRPAFSTSKLFSKSTNGGRSSYKQVPKLQKCPGRRSLKSFWIWSIKAF